MIKLASKLQPGDIIFYYGKEAMIEFIQSYSGTIIFRHTYAREFCQSDARFHVISPMQHIVIEAEGIIRDMQ